jgi:hypothetical protein
MNILKDHMATVAMVVSLFLVLATVVWIVLSGRTATDGPILVGLVALANTIGGAIAGKQLSNAAQNAQDAAAVAPTPQPPK